ncbi:MULTISPECIES: nitroreductase family protein [Butyricimonas]|uniref:nitroreductase family protein n=1 Tax=Butyricimonas TaxID=574697 RepID=UPI001D072277|nr:MULTISPECIES: nitroreductase family protein [Butyricimonas]MCB6974610.1 nitroreductase family protein [Butyricimonas synergistica]MCG4521352.1 nitroreductase family protein [Butyricimonas sp. DFI.6.44]
MDFYQVLERRRTIRDFSDKEVSNEVLEKILSAAFKAPTNDHLRQFEFVVVRGPENIARLVSPVVENTQRIQQTGLETAANVMDEDEHAMFVDALSKQQRMLIQSDCLVLPFFRQKDYPLCKPADQSSLNYFASAWAAVENILLAATAEGLACAFRIPIGNEPEHVKRLVNAPEGYEFTCFLAIGYPAENAHICKQKEINVEDRIHRNVW